MRNHTDWYRSIVGTDTEKAAAEKARITTSTLNRQLAKGVLSEGNVIAIARGYGKNPVDALIRVGYLTDAEVRGKDDELAARLTDQELIHELAMRINSEEAAWEETFSHSMGNELAARRKAKAHNPSPDSPPHVATPDYDAILNGINAGTEKIAAQKATDPLEENYT
ncbi:hypothetical protein D881_01875 [Corynebacterium ulcerans NCTC 12077]|uniref:DNA-binding protein n=1 Tax=Corynebacterium ulcerans FRC58 TaxID=1408268 RepID=A0ABM5TYQ2_CORUL|nr:hypothetical protein [Corynebacterium ulcerans]AKN76144.1 Hypothetical protein CulFRC58_0290 [Corynebacterium ulcerans FRC58]ESU59387.1 hypothetical protein D881_01875 [Corynebacterium ulcerans NCTC 12077]